MILAFDTATRATTVALADPPAEPLEARDDPAPGRRPNHASRLLPMAAELLDRVGAGWEEVERIAVGLGPGTFTGLRIGVATARALAQAREVPLVGISTLRSLALNAERIVQGAAAELEVALAVLDARRGEAFAAAWSLRESVVARAPATQEPLIAPAVLTPAALAGAASSLGATILAVGDGAVAFRVTLERSGVFVPEDGSGLHGVTAVNHCRLACGLEASAPDEILPEYLRLPDAELSRRPEGKR